MAVSVDVLASAEYVSARSRHVTVCTANMRSAALRVAEGMQTERYSTATWKTHPLHPQVADDAALAWIFTVDLLNFSFWPDEGEAELQIAYKGGAFSGYWALCSGINRALDVRPTLKSASCSPLRRRASRSRRRRIGSACRAPMSRTFFAA